MAKPFAPTGVVSTTLVMGVLLAAANRREPEFPLSVRVIEPSVVAPLINVTVKSKVPNVFGSASNPIVVCGVDRLIVRVVNDEYCAATLGVAVSAFGGEFQVLHPLTPT